MHDISYISNELKTLNMRDLQRKFEESCGYASHSFNREYLIKRILWCMQAAEEGSLSERARRRAHELANEADLRTRTPKKADPAPLPPDPSRDPRLPAPGTILRRPFKGSDIEVTVREKDFIWNGHSFKSLSSAVMAATGTRWNGFTFFNLTEA